MKKRILLVTQYFYPENFKSNDLAFEMSARGYKVHVLTGIPNYPTGKYYKGYSLFKRRKEVINNVVIYRSALIARGKGGGGRLFVNYLSWAFCSSFRALFLALIHRYDLIIVHAPSPITQGIPAIIIKRIQKIPLYFWIMDLWPESLVSAGNINNKWILNRVNTLVKWIYKNSDKLLITSMGFKKSILSKGNFEDKIVYFPNWGEDVLLTQNTFNIPLLPHGFRLMFAGNIGEAQDFESILQAALLLKENKNIHWVILGDGRKKAYVEDFIKKNSLESTLHLLGKYPLETMPNFFEKADVMLVTLKDEPIFNLTVPAKIQAYMAAKKPIIAMINGEGKEIIRNADCGFSVSAGDYKALAELVKEVSSMDKEILKRKGENGFEYYKANYTKTKCLDNLCKIIEN
ncbi:MAG TPA: glycosyltransferase family 4 protein [Bacteroidales bacterium]|nr:glycosyltransferase family 4 protein [Bacteroidales bacterium]